MQITGWELGQRGAATGFSAAIIGDLSRCTFAADDPPEEGAESTVSSQGAVPGRQSATETVYLVSGDANLRSSLLWILTSAGYAVEVRTHADEVFESDAEIADGCVVLDLCSSPTSAVALLDRLGRRHGLPPVILLTGYGDPLAVLRPRPVRTVTATRPFDLNLLDRVDEVMAESRRRRWLRETTAEFARQLASLTATERRVLDGLVGGQASDAAGAGAPADGAAADAERRRLMERLRVGSRGELLQRLLDLETGIDTTSSRKGD